MDGSTRSLRSARPTFTRWFSVVQLGTRSWQPQVSGDFLGVACLRAILAATCALAATGAVRATIFSRGALVIRLTPFAPPPFPPARARVRPRIQTLHLQADLVCPNPVVDAAVSFYNTTKTKLENMPGADMAELKCARQLVVDLITSMLRLAADKTASVQRDDLIAIMRAARGSL